MTSIEIFGSGRRLTFRGPNSRIRHLVTLRPLSLEERGPKRLWEPARVDPSSELSYTITNTCILSIPAQIGRSHLGSSPRRDTFYAFLGRRRRGARYMAEIDPASLDDDIKNWIGNAGGVEKGVSGMRS